jgi:hypothetical protein
MDSRHRHSLPPGENTGEEITWCCSPRARWRALSIRFAYFLVNQIQTFPPGVAALYLKIIGRSIQGGRK